MTTLPRRIVFASVGLAVPVDDPGREDGFFWTADGREVLYRAWGTGQPDVRIAWLDRGTTVALTRLDSHNSANGVFIQVPSLAVSAGNRRG